MTEKEKLKLQSKLASIAGYSGTYEFICQENTLEQIKNWAKELHKQIEKLMNDIEKIEPTNLMQK